MHYLSKTTNNLAHLYDLTLKLENPTGEILPDMFARVEIVKAEIPDAICVPLYSVISRNNEQIVYTVSDNQAHMRKVELGLLDGWQCEVKKGLVAGEQVLVVGQRNVTDGQKVNVVRRVKDAGEILQ
jgi:multidrug efflux pump subunit AcrA (membrane-fusion protein)